MQDKGWSDYWEKDGAAGGEVFVNAKGGRHPALAEFWLSRFADLAEGARVLDVASGAGSIYAHLDPGHGLDLHATDIAPCISYLVISPHGLFASVRSSAHVSADRRATAR